MRASPSVYRLYYFPKRGRGEQVRLMLAELGAEWKEVRVDRANFREMSEQGPRLLAFGCVPMLEEGDLRLVQGPVILGYLARTHGLVDAANLRAAARADAIAWGAEDLRVAYFRLFGEGAEARQGEFAAGPWRDRWLRAFEGLLDLEGERGFFVGGALTHADIAVWDAIDAVLAWVRGASLDGFPRVARFYEAVRVRPRIAAYLASDRRPTG